MNPEHNSVNPEIDKHQSGNISEFIVLCSKYTEFWPSMYRDPEIQLGIFEIPNFNFMYPKYSKSPATYLIYIRQMQIMKYIHDNNNRLFFV